MKKLLPLLFITFFVIQANAQIIITGCMKDPGDKGGDLISNNSTYEYLQLRATENISEGNFKVVFSSHVNDVQRFSGWVNNPYVVSVTLENISLNKGEYFYIVAIDPAKLNGVDGTVFPAGVKKYKITITKELFANSNTAPTAIAVFNLPKSGNELIDIDRFTRPIDAVFIKGNTTNLICLEKIDSTDETIMSESLGYTLPIINDENDALYFNRSNTDGNCYILTGNVTNGVFNRFNGHFNELTKTWTSPRSGASYVTNPTSIGDIEGYTTLPVNLKSFTSSNSNNQAKLIWNTAEETNFRAFEIEKSEDGINFSIIGTLNAKGSNSNYSFNVNQNQEVVYYKLKMVDYDGNYSYSYITSLNLSLKTDLAIYPNPTSDYINFTASKDSKLKISFSNGKVVKELNATKGLNTLDVRDLMVGVYYINLEGSVLKFVKQ